MALDKVVKKRANELCDRIGKDNLHPDGGDAAWQVAVEFAEKHRNADPEVWETAIGSLEEELTNPPSDKQSASHLVQGTLESEDDSSAETEETEEEETEEEEADLETGEPTDIAEVPASDRVVTPKDNAPPAMAYVPQHDNMGQVEAELRYVGLKALTHANALEGPLTAQAGRLAADWYFLKTHGTEGLKAEENALKEQKEQSFTVSELRDKIKAAMFRAGNPQDDTEQKAIDLATSDRAIGALLTRAAKLAKLFNGAIVPYEKGDEDWPCYGTTHTPGLGVYWFPGRYGNAISADTAKLINEKTNGKAFLAVGAWGDAIKPMVKDPDGGEYHLNTDKDREGLKRIRQLRTPNIDTLYSIYFEGREMSKTGGLIAKGKPGGNDNAPSEAAEEVIASAKKLKGKEAYAAGLALSERMTKEQRGAIIQAVADGGNDTVALINAVLPALSKAADEGKLGQAKPRQYMEAAHFVTVLVETPDCESYLKSTSKDTNPTSFRRECYNAFIDLRDVLNEVLRNCERIAEPEDHKATGTDG